MKSIRVSLIVYFLSLLLLGLGGVSVLAYRTTAENLRDKEHNGRLFLDAEHEDTEHRLREEFDRKIHRNAKRFIDNLGRPLNLLERAAKELHRMTPFNGFSAMPLGYLNAVTDLRAAREPRSLNPFIPIVADWDQDEERHPIEAGQTYFAEGQVFERTNNLSAQPFTLDPHYRETAELLQPYFDNVVLGDKELRRVSLQVRSSRPPFAVTMPRPQPQGKGGKGGKGNAFTQNPPKDWKPPPQIHYVQYAVEVTPLKNRLARLDDDRERRSAQLSEDTQTIMQDLRRQLFYVCGLTATSVLVGGLTLIWIGLAPLRRLSDAVSRINEKDFHLRLDPQSLPSELQPVAKRLGNSLDQLQKAFAREKQAAQDISHDLRTPLAALTTTIEVALKKDRSSAEYREMMEECQVSAQQMSHLVERLLALARIDAGSNPARPRPLDVTQIALHAADLVRPLAKARDIVLSVHAPAELPLLADADKLREVLVNLLHNAVDYNRDAGAIDLFVERALDVVEIRVTDTGIGIYPEARERLFERFYRADPSRHSDTPHCGLGLAIVKSYVDLMNGTIHVDSQLGEGTTFTIRLPFVGHSANPEAVMASNPQEVLA